ncbi:hypothetical protein FVE85_8862 [Porphyridium purpureum]|uniref:Uncharacterized protein n=1 Tax=Porphyridium purpureum TaxID=35688 RepID=A0A5J4YSK7_PORPP|nr:hypothetical protein FVE85_8862 [Porphyridium purpureum]|eukprot:POR2907..scf296_7
MVVSVHDVKKRGYDELAVQDGAWERGLMQIWRSAECAGVDVPSPDLGLSDCGSQVLSFTFWLTLFDKTSTFIVIRLHTIAQCDNPFTGSHSIASKPCVPISSGLHSYSFHVWR